MFEPEQVARFERQITAMIRNAALDDPEAFAQVVAIIDGAKAQLVDAAAQLRSGHQVTARREGVAYSWADLGAALGVTRAAAQKRFGRKVAV